MRAIQPLGVLLEAQCSIDDRIHRWCEFALVYLPTFGSEPLLVILALDPIVVRWIESILDQVRKQVRVVLLVPGTIPRISSIDPRASTPESAAFAAGGATDHASIRALGRERWCRGRRAPDYQGPGWVAYEKDYDDPTYELSPSDALVERIGEFVAHRPIERLDHLLLRAAAITDLDELEAELAE